MPTIAEQLAELVKQKKALANNITTKGVAADESEKLNTLVPKVLQIQGGGGQDTSDATAQNNDVRDGKTFYARGQKLIGNMPTISSQTVTPSNSNQTITGNGYLEGNITISGDSNLNANNIKKNITIFGVTGNLDPGLDTSDASAIASDIKAGMTAYAKGEKITGTLKNKGDVTVTVDGQEHILEGGAYDSITVPGDANLISSNIAQNVTIYGVTGDSNVMDTTEDASTTASSSNVQTGMSAYVNGKRIVGIADPLVISGDNVDYIPTTEDQIIQGPRILQGNKTMTIKGDAELIPDNIRKGVTIFGVTGSYVPQWTTLIDTTSFTSKEETYDTYGAGIRFYTSDNAIRNLSYLYDQDVANNRTYDSSYINEGRGYGVGLAPQGQSKPKFLSFGLPLNLTEGSLLFKTKFDQVSWGQTTFKLYLQASTEGSWGTRITDFAQALENEENIINGVVNFGSSQTPQEVIQEITIPTAGKYYAYIVISINVDNAAPTLNKLMLMNF